MIERQIVATIKRYDMLRRGDRVLVAVSGGADSTALLAVLRSLAPEMGLELHVAHLDHGWRGRASAEDAEFVRRQAIRWGLPVTVGHVDPSVWSLRDGRQSSREARARQLRTSFLVETARQIGAQKVALGHTRDDQAESMLLRLLRGSGARGLSGTFPVLDGVFIRPLIEIRRRDILAYLRSRRLRYRVDSTNRDTKLTRNRVRRQLLPLLEKRFNPSVTDALAQTAELFRDEDDFLSRLADSEASKIATPRPGGILLAGGPLRRLPAAIQRRILRKTIADLRGDLHRITLLHIEQSRRLLDQPGGRGAVNLPDGVVVRKQGEDLVILRRAAPSVEAAGEGADAARGAEIARGQADVASARTGAGPCLEALCPVPGEVSLTGFGLRLRASVVPRDEAAIDLKSGGPERAYLDADLLPGPLLIRPRRPGDRFVPLGAPGSRKVKSFLIDRKVPVDERGRIPLVLSGDRIAWVVSHAIDDRFKVTDRTRRILVLEKESR
jgi:tRNA(Ile)-lysidine synthase